MFCVFSLISTDLLFVQYGYFVFLFHMHDDSTVRSRRPVVVPVPCPHQNHGHPTAPPNWKSQNCYWLWLWKPRSSKPVATVPRWTS